MSRKQKLTRLLRTPRLTTGRIVAALAIAVIADSLQLLLGPLGWVFADQIIDVIAMVFTTLTIGFHPLLLPTFVMEFIPLVDMLPTWTGCVVAVIILRRRAERAAQQPPPPPKILRDEPPIDI